MTEKLQVTNDAFQEGFSLVELMVAAMIFTFVCISVSQLFAQALDIQRRATGYSRMQENALFVLESIAREVRVSVVDVPITPCSDTLTIEHPDHGTVIYKYDSAGFITRQNEKITSDDVAVKAFQFCVSGAGVDNEPARVTIPMTLEAVSARAIARVSVSLQTTMVSRDLVEELTN